MNEASARIKINKLLEAAGWRFFDEPEGSANIQLEVGVKLQPDDLDAMGDDFEHIKSKRGVVDFLLLDQNESPLVVLEAKSEAKNQMTSKEKASFGAMIGNVASATEVESLAIPLALVEIQQSTILGFETEQSIVYANRNCTTRIETKTLNEIGRVWSDEASRRGA